MYKYAIKCWSNALKRFIVNPSSYKYSLYSLRFSIAALVHKRLVAIFIISFAVPLPALAASLKSLAGDGGVLISLAIAAANSALQDGSQRINRETMKRYGIAYNSAYVRYDEAMDKVRLSGNFTDSSAQGRFSYNQCRAMLGDIAREADKALADSKKLDELTALYSMIRGGRKPPSPARLAKEARKRLVISASVKQSGGKQITCASGG